jgi:protease-4
MNRSSGRVPRALLALGFAIAPLMPAAAEDPGRPVRPALPGTSIAGDDGASTIFVNPASLALDPDPSYFLQVRQTAIANGPTSFAGAFNLGSLGTVVSWWRLPNSPGAWTISESLGIRLDRSLSLGGRIVWVLPEGSGDRFTTGDLGVTWRPTHWLGLGATTWNIAGSARAAGLPGVAGVGVTLRPLEDRLLFSVDTRLNYDTPNSLKDTLPPMVVQGAMRLRLADGLALRMTADSVGLLGLGVEVGVGDARYGGYAAMPVGGSVLLPDGPDFAASIQDLGDEGRLRGARPKVARFDLSENFPYQPVAPLFGRAGESYLGLSQRLEKAAKDPSIKGIFIDLDGSSFSLAEVEELRALIKQARDAEKLVVAWLGGTPNNASYLLGSAADKVYMHPAGELELVGLSAEVQFFRGTLDILGVEPTVVKRAEYKSAPERFTHTASSEAAREQLDALLDDLSGAWAEGIAQSRGREVADLWALVDGGPYGASDAEKRGLVDGLLYDDQIEEKLEELFGDEPALDDAYAANKGIDGWRNAREIAVIYITGAITGGESAGPGFFGGGFTTGSETVVRQLQAAAEDDAVKAVVLRVDSPGGSAFASEEIWRAVEKLKGNDKPVVVSMGSVAASGGYYVAANADAIYANRSTITGSIGVYFGPLLNLDGLYDKVGVNTELYTRGRHASMYSSSKAPDPSELAALERLVGETYAQFKQRVETGRKLKPEEVENVARGRVWSGQRALGNGLVDQLGTFTAAIDRARAEAGIEDGKGYSLVTYTNRTGPDGSPGKRGAQAMQQVLEQLRPQVPNLNLPGLEWVDQTRRLGNDRVWAMLPYTVEVE